MPNGQRPTLDNVTKRFGDVVAVDDVSIEVQDREFLVLVGPSGCGKSTTLRMVAGLEELTGGNIYIGDRLVNDVPPKDRDIAMVFQSYALYPHMSVYDNLAFGLKLRKTPKAEIQRRVAEAADMLNISELMDRKPRALSGGQRQRVAVGRAIVRDPAVFLMDEPLSNLDAKLRVQTRAELIRLHERLQATVIYVTHDQMEAMTMGTRIAVLRDGVLQQLGPPQEVYAAPSNVFVGGFIGSPAMNFFDARDLGRGRPVGGNGNPADSRAARPARCRGAPCRQGRDLRHPSGEHRRPAIRGGRREPRGDHHGDRRRDGAAGAARSSSTCWRARTHSSPASTRGPRAQANQPFELAFEMDRMHLFDRATQEAIA